MRKQQRPPEPTAFIENSAKWRDQWLELKARNPGAGFQWYAFGGKTAREWALPALREMNQEHCSFCDAFPLRDRVKIPIEHFRPKLNSSRPEFASLAYDWSNLYYCCPFCQSEKGEKWDDGLIAPDEPGYSFEQYFRFDFTTGAILLNPFAAANDRVRAEVTIRLYGLDKPDKRRARLLALRQWTNSIEKILDESSYRDFVEPAEKP